jgi:hypothetical protein
MDSIILGERTITRNSLKEMSDGEILDLIYLIFDEWENPIMSKLEAIEWTVRNSIAY